MFSYRVTQNSRIYWLDALRGLAIIAVVLGHINIGLMQAGLTQGSPEIYKFLHKLLYAVHMPLFAFLFGLNIPGAWEKRQSWSYVGHRLLQFLYLYIIWTIIQGSFEVIGSRFANGATTWNDVLNFINPLAHLWYLPWMMIVYLGIIIFKPWKSWMLASIALILCASISWVTWGTDYPEFYRRGLSIGIFALFGALIGTKRVRLLEGIDTIKISLLATVPTVIFTLLIANATAFTVPTLGDPAQTLQSKMLGMLASISGVAATLLWAPVILRLERLRLLATIGVFSLQIYLMHLLLTPTVRIISVKVGIVDPLAIMITSLLVGVSVPLIASQLFYRQIMWLFEIPSFSKRYQAKRFR